MYNLIIGYEKKGEYFPFPSHCEYTCHEKCDKELVIVEEEWYSNKTIMTWLDDIGKIFFLSKAEAEAKLEELKEGGE